MEMGMDGSAVGGSGVAKPDAKAKKKKRRGPASVKRSRVATYRRGQGAAARWTGGVAPQSPGEGPDGESDPAAIFPDGYRHLAEAEAAFVGAASEAARDEKRWVGGKPLIDWQAVRLQYGRGRTQREIAT